ncbi:hypothetical protein U5817_09845 [Aromatoleum evansii]|uniref:Transposase n=1 Tax=Aromatoleum evansii TaxID=59406 RepID=A0ABZ1AW45_AROEV|nr:hypothetical protein U5817_09495 [Aromatoleum evansii]WRL48328.1 hypothetical protein U5817_09845 [Aromatoleum evansii]
MTEQRIDWHMRQFCDEISAGLAFGMSPNAALRRMTARGVPFHVQRRICGALQPEAIQC